MKIRIYEEKIYKTFMSDGEFIEEDCRRKRKRSCG
jgi:hypothetical protein